MTTIVTKNGSGAPLASDLVQGELAVDLTNKRLYTEDSGGSVIELGSNPSTLTVTGDLTVDTNTLFVDSANNRVGIGTSSPGYPLDTNGEIRGDMFLLRANGTLPTAVAGMYRPATGNIAFGLGSSEHMRIDASGNVGISQTSPVAFGSGIPTLSLKGNSAGSPTRAGALVFDSQSGSGGGAYLYVDAGQLRFGTGSSTGLAASERMRIDSSGNLLVGKTAAGVIADIGAELGASGYVIGSRDAGIALYCNRKSTSGTLVNFSYNGATVGTISTNGTITAYNTSSDVRLKENITDAPAGNIDSLKVRSFDWKADGSHQEYGFVAQELDEVAPYAVSKGETEDDMWGVDYSKLVPMLVKEIQDLKAEVAALKGA